MVDETIAAEGEGLKSQVDMTDSDQLNPIIEQVALGVFPAGGNRYLILATLFYKEECFLLYMRVC